MQEMDVLNFKFGEYKFQSTWNMVTFYHENPEHLQQIIDEQGHLLDKDGVNILTRQENTEEEDILVIEPRLEGMSCEIDGCSTHKYLTYNSYTKHWKKVHTDTITITFCGKCKRSFIRKNDLLRHLKTDHKLCNETAALMSVDAKSKFTTNNNYINPGHVEGCKTPHFLKHDNYVQHWKKFHEKSIVIYDCSMVGCTIQSTEKSRIIKHQKICHKQLDKNNTLSSYVEPNITFRKYVRVNITAREAARKARQQYVIDHPVNFNVKPNNSLAVSRGQYVDIDFNNNCAKVFKNKVAKVWEEDVANKYFIAKVFGIDITYGDVTLSKTQTGSQTNTTTMASKKKIPEAWKGKEDQVWTGPYSGYKERTWRVSDRDVACPVPECPVITRNLREHALADHLSPMFET
ncbi:unnamed protein product [Mytilus coruscus]|uniref:C2H2-type domain-containing protein n=1 Tax=Mytilus coruscus TaxID=42192 RepID=A0A6J8E677_MYTCO|nr:unnamed protein product [Mytilus coruscus]